MSVDRDRWPDPVLKFVDAVTCPRCGAARDRVMVTVRYATGIWRFTINCPACSTMHATEWIDMFGQLRPKPEKVPLPAWVLSVAKELG